MEKEYDVVVGGEKIKFFIEEMVICKGEFSKWYKVLGSFIEMVFVSMGLFRKVNFRGIFLVFVSSMGEREVKKS